MTAGRIGGIILASNCVASTRPWYRIDAVFTSKGTFSSGKRSDLLLGGPRYAEIHKPLHALDRTWSKNEEHSSLASAVFFCRSYDHYLCAECHFERFDFGPSNGSVWRGGERRHGNSEERG